MSNIYDSRPAASVAAVTASNANDLPAGSCRALYVGVSGDVAVMMPDGTTATFKSAAVGYHPIKARRVLSTGTTATDIVALY